jgi:hypothetical protein
MRDYHDESWSLAVETAGTLPRKAKDAGRLAIRQEKDEGQCRCIAERMAQRVFRFPEQRALI